MRTKLVLAALVVGALAAGCGTATLNLTSAATPPATTIAAAAPDSSGAVPAGNASASASEAASFFPHGEGPIPGTSADLIAKAWAAYWHATPTPFTELGWHATRLTVDFPSAYGKLYMMVDRQSAEATAARQIYCELSDASLGMEGYIAMTRKAVEQFVSGCAGPALKDGETKQVIDYVASHDKSDNPTQCVSGRGKCQWEHRVDLERFQLVVQTSPGHVCLYLLGRKA